MNKRIFLKNAEIVSSKTIVSGGIVLNGSKIESILKPDEVPDGDFELIDCTGKYVLPGLIDAHVHFREPGASYKEDWDSGSRDAISGGVTTVLDMPNNTPPVLTRNDLELKRSLIDSRSYVNYGLYIGCNGDNFDEISKAHNIPGVKVYLANSTGNMGINIDGLSDLLSKTTKKIVVHAEDQDCIRRNEEKLLNDVDLHPSVHSKIRSVESAVIAVKQVCMLSVKYPNRIHIAHVSTEKELEIISEYKEFGVTCEVTPHHLSLSEDDYDVLGNFIKVNPPVRAKSDLFALWKALKFGIIDIVATDHAPHLIKEKEQNYNLVPSGVPGVSMLLPFLLNVVSNDGLALNDIVKFCCEKPAEIFSIQNKGKIESGFDADIVVVDMDLEKKLNKNDIYSKSAWSPYENLLFKGWPVMTFVMGELSFDNGKFSSFPNGVEALFS